MTRSTNWMAMMTISGEKSSPPVFQGGKVGPADAGRFGDLFQGQMPELPNRFQGGANIWPYFD